MAGEKYNGKEKFNWTKETVPKFKLSQCVDCLNSIEDGAACEIYGRPKPDAYALNKVNCKWYKNEK
jgi:hypothetical protein